jgi:hypothetical protein
MNRWLKIVNLTLIDATIIAVSMGQTSQPTKPAQQPVQPDVYATQASVFIGSIKEEFATCFLDEPSGDLRHKVRWTCVNHHPLFAAANLRKTAEQFPFITVHRSTTGEAGIKATNTATPPLP